MPEFQNPNLQSQGPGGGGTGGGGMQSTLALIFLAFAVFLGYQYFQKPKPAAPPPQPQQSEQQTAGTQSSTPLPASTPASAAQKSPAPSPAAPTIAAAGETETTIENDVYRIVLDNRGALVKSWVLKDSHYKDSSGKHQLDMVQVEASKRFGFPLSLFTYEPSLNQQLNGAFYQVMSEGKAVPDKTVLHPAAGAPVSPDLLAKPSSVTFHYAQGGVDVVKTLSFDKSYVLHVDVEVKRNGQPVRALVAWPAGLGDMEEFQGRSTGIVPGLSRTPSMFAWSIDGKQDITNAPKVSNNATMDAAYQYAATSDLYFTAAFLPDNPTDATVVTFHNTIDLLSKPSDPNSEKKPADVIGLAVGDTSGTTRLRLYAGPKQMDLVSGIHSIGGDGKPDGPTLEHLIQFGTWLGVIAKPLFLALRFLYDHGISNWGWDIIVLTVIFNLILFPTRLMMMKQSVRMARLQPKVETIKRKYANLKATDPKRAEMNQEMMALYKAEGVNMYGGCLPMLLQMPLFFAYFRVLQNTVELRQAHWLWLSDLSAPDPMHVLPIIIIITMFLTQYITPSPGMDQSQRRMMAFMMPVMFGYMLWYYASGLALYWGTGNIISLIMQISINQSHIGKELHEIAARRAAKKAGLRPKVIQGKR